jgi:hypothetical protein
MNRTNCSECRRLTSELRQMESVYATTRGLLAVVYTSSDSRLYRVIKIAADDSRVEYELARTGLDQHWRVHSSAN